MEELTLKQFQKKYGIRRIDFSKVHEVKKEETYASNKLICPYCGSETQYEGEDTDEILRGTSRQCPFCNKWFYAEGEMSIDITCTPIENKILEPITRRCIERVYSLMDKCDESGCKWDNPFGVVEWETYKNYAEPLFANMEGENEKS